MDTYAALADLPIRVEAANRRTQTQATSSGFDRTSSTIALHGTGCTGRGEDVTYDRDAHDDWPAIDALSGAWTIDTFSTAVDDVDLFPETSPPGAGARHYRRWAIESAALDLALRQADQSLGTVLDRRYDPVRFVVSTRVPDGDTTRVHDLLDAVPDTEFKLDATVAWTDAVTTDLATTDAVRVIDLKGQYADDTLREPADRSLYDRVLSAFPTTIIEDPNVDDAVEDLLADHRHRLAWDAPITSVDSIQERPWPPTWLNIKPSRFGRLETLCTVLDYAHEHDIDLYGGGQFELDVGRHQLQALAALFYPAAPNDLAPTTYNAATVPQDPPTSPLSVPRTPGFGW